MFLFQKNHGAISVFLILILVPCMLVASIFVDVSRVHFSKAVAESSADLALSTLMANYDYDLSQYYGLVGSCQDINKYYSVVSGFYEEALHSADVTDDEIKLLYQRVYGEAAGFFRDETISDLLLIQNKTDGDVVSAIEGAHMHNSTILQKQIVEFMKYRGPIVILDELIHLLEGEAGQGGVQGSEEAAANEPMTEAQENYYNAESELLKAANQSYWALRAYSDLIKQDNFTVSKLRETQERVSSYRDSYREIHKYLVKNLYNTEGLTRYTRPTVAENAHTYAKEDPSISKLVYPTPVPTPTPDPSAPPTPTPNPLASPTPTPVPTPTPEPEYHVEAGTATNLTNGLSNAIAQFEAKRDAVTNAGSDLMNKLPDSGTYNKIQWWVQMNAKINSSAGTNLSSEVRSAGDSMMDACAKVEAMVQCTPPPGVTWDTANNLKNKAREYWSKYLRVAGSNDAYVKTVAKLEEVSANNLKYINPSELRVTVNGKGTAIPAALSEISSDLTSIKAKMNEYISCLNDVINGNSEKKIPSLATIRQLVRTCGSSLDTWENRAKGAKVNGENTELSVEHQKTITKIRNGDGTAEEDEGENEYKSDAAVRQITISEVDALEKRLKNARSQFEAMVKAIDAMRYGSKQIMSIGDYQTFKSAASGQVSADAIPLAENELNQYAESTFSALFVPKDGDVVTLHDLSDLEYSPYLHYKEKIDAMPELYRKYCELFKDLGDSEVKDQQGKLDDKKKDFEKKEEEIKEKGSKRYPGPPDRDLPTATDGAFGFGTVLGSLTTAINRLIKLDITAMRDDIYVTEYIMKMFSYATFENENYFELVKDNKRLGELSLKNYTDIYDDFTGDADKEGTWRSEKLWDSYNKTLTNEMINEANNHAYQAEVEYILFGDTNVKNVKSAYDAIYGIRYVLNLASAFLNFWGMTTNTGKAVNAIATTVSGATAFIIPAPLVKLVLLPILTAFETGNDLDRLQAGFRVELYKKNEDWWYSLELAKEHPGLDDFFDMLSGEFPNEKERIQNAHGLRYSDYLTLFVYLGLSDEDGSADSMYQRMANVIEANMKRRTKDENYSLEKTKVYFKLNSKLRVEPLMLTLPLFSDEIDDPTMKDDWCTFEVETFRGY